MGKTKHKLEAVRAVAGLPSPDAGSLAQDLPYRPPRLCILSASIPGETIGHQLERVRLAHKLSIPEASEKLGVDRRLLHRLEKDREIPSPRMVKKIQDGYGVTVGIFGRMLSTKIRPIVRSE